MARRGLQGRRDPTAYSSDSKLLVTIRWTPSEPPVGYVFDVYIEEPGIGQREAEAASTNEDLSREQAATNLLVGTVRIIVKQVHANERRVNSSQ